MSLEIQRSDRYGVTLLAIDGRLVMGSALETFRATLEALLSEGCIRIVLDLTNVDYIDSSALGCLVVAHTKVEKAGGVMTMFGLNRRQIELLVITKLATVFRIADNELDAVNLCFPERQTRTFDILDFVRKQRGGMKGSEAE